MLLAILQSQHGADKFYYIYHIRNFIRVTENVINHIWRCLKLDCFTSTQWRPDFARLINNCIIIYNKNSGMTVKTVYIPICLLPNILWHYFDAAFLLKPHKLTAAYLVIDVNNEVKLTIQKLASQPSNSLNIINLTPKNRNYIFTQPIHVPTFHRKFQLMVFWIDTILRKSYTYHLSMFDILHRF